MPDQPFEPTYPAGGPMGTARLFFMRRGPSLLAQAALLLALGACSEGKPPAPAAPLRKSQAFDSVAAPERLAVEASAAFRPDWGRQEFSHDLWDEVLQRRVEAGGLVDYVGLQTDRVALDEYVYRIQETDPRAWTREARMAFWINAYNALTLRGVLALLPADPARWPRFSLVSVTPVFWKTTRFRAGTRELTLDAIEQDVLRAEFRDGRLHAALNCASRGCPRLQPRAFVAGRLEAQLDAACADWASDPAHNRLEGSRLLVSAIFEWYARDFEGGPRVFLARYARDAAFRQRLAGPETLTIETLEYDWALNVR